MKRKEKVNNFQGCSAEAEKKTMWTNKQKQMSRINDTSATPNGFRYWLDCLLSVGELVFPALRFTVLKSFETHTL
jgi:hypothetical protein